MSVPYDSLKCERCEASFSLNYVWGNFFYEMPNGTRFPLERNMAWCHSCAATSEVEDLEHSSNLQNQLGELAHELASLTRGFGSFMPAHRKRSQELAAKIENVRQHIDYLKKRTDPPRCLTCGSPDWIDIPRTGFSHPGCGGEFRHVHAEFFISETSQTYLYDPSGRLLRELGDW